MRMSDKEETDWTDHSRKVSSKTEMSDENKDDLSEGGENSTAVTFSDAEEAERNADKSTKVRY